MLATAAVATGPANGPGLIEVSFVPAVEIPSGGQLAFGIIAPLAEPVDATLFGTDTLPNDLSATDPAYFTGFYVSNALGELGLAVGNHYLEIAAAAVPTSVPDSGTSIVLLAGSLLALDLARYHTLCSRDFF